MKISTSKSLLNESVSEEQAEKTQETHTANGEEPLYSPFYILPSLSPSLSLSLSPSTNLTFVGGLWLNMITQILNKRFKYLMRAILSIDAM